MSSNPAEQLARADHCLRRVVSDLDQRAEQPIALADVQALTAAVQRYQQAVLTCLSTPAVDIHQLTPAQLLAYRQADPVYRLGYVRGYHQGQAQAQHATAPVLSAYVQHATLPPPTAAPPADYATLVQQVRRVLATMQQRYSGRPLTAISPARPL